MENKTVNILGEEYSIMFVDEYPERFSDFEESSDALCNFYDEIDLCIKSKRKIPNGRWENQLKQKET
jgi:hypothetical protein